jgi:hypothetical protein
MGTDPFGVVKNSERNAFNSLLHQLTDQSFRQRNSRNGNQGLGYAWKCSRQTRSASTGQDNGLFDHRQRLKRRF